MFDERSERWIVILMGYTQVMFWLYMIAGAIMCLCGWSGSLGWIDDGFIDGIVCLAGGAFLAFSQLVANMLIIQFLNNVQVIREKVEKM